MKHKSYKYAYCKNKKLLNEFHLSKPYISIYLLRKIFHNTNISSKKLNKLNKNLQCPICNHAHLTFYDIGGKGYLRTQRKSHHIPVHNKPCPYSPSGIRERIYNKLHYIDKYKDINNKLIQNTFNNVTNKFINPTKKVTKIHTPNPGDPNHPISQPTVYSSNNYDKKKSQRVIKKVTLSHKFSYTENNIICAIFGKLKDFHITYKYVKEHTVATFHMLKNNHVNPTLTHWYKHLTNIQPKNYKNVLVIVICQVVYRYPGQKDPFINILNPHDLGIYKIIQL